MKISEQEIRKYRLNNQQLNKSKFESPVKLVEWMGAMQAQDRLMVNWGMGVRLSGNSLLNINQSFSQGEIIRTHVLRPTWHLVPAADIRWMLNLTAPFIKAGMKARLQQLSLDAALLNRCSNIIVDALRQSSVLGREQLMQILRNENILTDENRSSHILMHAELEGLICSGPETGKKHTYCLLENRVPDTLSLSQDESLSTLTKRYFRSHGPATLADFAWWSGLGIKMARNGIEMNRNGMISATNGNSEYFFYDNELTQPGKIQILPAFDEYLISYRDRKELLPPDHEKNAISSNGIFYPVVIQDGIAVATWTKQLKKNRLTVRIRHFETPSSDFIKEVKSEFISYGKFCGQEIIFED